jgi:hypothetical protein
MEALQETLLAVTKPIILPPWTLYPCRWRHPKVLMCRLWLPAEFWCLNPRMSDRIHNSRLGRCLNPRDRDLSDPGWHPAGWPKTDMLNYRKLAPFDRKAGSLPRFLVLKGAARRVKGGA